LRILVFLRRLIDFKKTLVFQIASWPVKYRFFRFRRGVRALKRIYPSLVSDDAAMVFEFSCWQYG
jgi:hypothetical protein